MVDTIKNREINEDVFNTRYVIFDTETAPITTVKPMPTEVIELGWVVVENGEIVSSQSTLVKPMYSIPYNVSSESGITNEMVLNSPIITEAIIPFVEDLRNSVIVGHNIKYDISSISESLSRRSSNPQEIDIFEGLLSIDTLPLFNKLFPGESRKLKNVMHVLGIEENEKRHRALADARYTSLALLKLISLAHEKYRISRIKNLIQFANTGNPNFQESLF